MFGPYVAKYFESAGKDIALLLDGFFEGLNQFVFALGIAPKERYDLQRVHLSLVLLRLEPLILRAQLLASELVLFERSLARFELDSSHII